MRSVWSYGTESGKALLALMALAIAAAVPAEAQQHERTEWVWRHINNDQRFEMTLRGVVSLTDDERAVASLSPGGRLQIEEAIPGRPTRMVIISADDRGTLSRVYLVDGQQQAWESGASQWLAQLLPRAAREQGIGAEARVRRIHQQSGAAGVLSEIEQIESSSSRRTHLRALIALGPIPQREMPRTLEAIGRTSSSSNRAAMLRDLAPQVDLRDARQRAAWFSVIDETSSSSERRAVLLETAARQDASAEPVLVRLLEVTSRIPSSSERAAVLVVVAERHALDADRVREAFFSALNGIPSSSERRRVLLSVLSRHGGSAPVTRAVIRSASMIPSDSEKTTVLLGVPLSQLRDQRTAELYRESTDSIRSSSNRERALRHLVGALG